MALGDGSEQMVRVGYYHQTTGAFSLVEERHHSLHALFLCCVNVVAVAVAVAVAVVAVADITTKTQMQSQLWSYDETTNRLTA
jgi:hypothetical protein